MLSELVLRLDPFATDAAVKVDVPRGLRPVKSRMRSGTAVRLFLTCWILYMLHVATDVVREHYLALGIGDNFSFRVDEYGGLHPDLFETEQYGWHIGNNPGVSMLAAIPYALMRPVTDWIVEQSRARRGSAAEAPAFETHRPNARIFYQRAWERGLDIKLGLAALVMHALFMAPLSALFATFLFWLLRDVFRSDRVALGLALLYAFGTPAFMRTGFLNHNLMLGHIAFVGFVLMWHPFGKPRWSSGTRYFLGGVAGGTALLFDYSGAVILLALFAYALVRRYQDAGLRDAVRHGTMFFLGTLGPVFLLWFYQWRSFGNPFLPGQHWMPPVQWIDEGYQGYELPQPDLFARLLFDIRFGLFATCPLFLLALLAPWANRGRGRRVPGLELAFMLLLTFGMVVFFSGVNYTRLQFNTGIRYLAPIFPFLFVPAAIALMRLRSRAVYFVAASALALAWAQAMYRWVNTPLGVLDPLIRTFTRGFTLPALETLGNTTGQYGSFWQDGVSPLPLFAVAAVLIFGIWAVRPWPKPDAPLEEPS